MTAKNDGGPAFPENWDDGSPTGHLANRKGMALRDWFAGQALSALIEDVNRPTDQEQGDSTEHPRDAIARRAYAIADAMLKAREDT